ncbi:MAG: T9SS type A sorting domain-containing protein [Chitinophagaceae bacterium]
MKKIYFFLAILFIAGSASAQIVAWNNTSLSGVTSGSLNATTNNANLATSVLSRGSGIVASTLVSGYSSTSWNIADQNAAIAGDRYYQVIISASSGYQVSLSTLDARLRRTGTSPNAYIWRYSIDGTTFMDIGSVVSFTTTGTSGDVQTQVNLSGITALQNVLSSITITLRLYAWGASSSIGSLAFGTVNANSLAIGGTVALQSPLPVGLLSFAGQKDGTKNILRWTTASENNNKGFEVQYSKDGIHYSAAGFVPSLARGGYSDHPLQYSFTDINPEGFKQYYRLNQVDHDGRTKLSTIVVVRSDRSAKFSIGGLFPNPVTVNTLNVFVDAPKIDMVTLVIADPGGKVLMKKNANVEVGTNTISLDVNRLGKGLYFIKLLSSENGETAVNRFIKQ